MSFSRLLILPFVLNSAVIYAASFETNTWPGEGRPTLISKKNNLLLFARPDAVSERIEIPYENGWLIPFDKSRLQTLKSDTLVVKKPETRQIWCGQLENVQFKMGDEVEVLQYRAEGVYTSRLDGRLCEIPIYGKDNLFGKLPEPVVNWWVRFIYADGSSPGWLLVEHDQVKFGRRTF